MLDMILQTLSIFGIILLVWLALFLTIIVLVLFFPVTYRFCGRKGDEGIRCLVKVKWLLGIFRIRYQYPEPGHLTVKALCFTLFDTSLSGDHLEDEEQAAGDGTENRRKEKKGNKAKKTKANKKNVKENKPKKKKGKDTFIDSEKEVARAEDNWGESNQNTQDERASYDEDREYDGRREGRSWQVREDTGGAALAEANETVKDIGAGQASSSEDTDTESDCRDSASGESKIFLKFQKIKYTICRMYDKIKKIWKNISYYMELLREEETKQLFAHVLLRGGKIWKSIHPRHMKVNILFGTGTPDTTGYAYGAYCMLTSAIGPELCVTPDFERAVLEGEAEVSGHIVIWVFVWNGIKLCLDRKFRRFLKKLKMQA